ncbi:Glutamate--glyoxylate aminotransferase 2 [Asimina triloba]
MLPDMHTFPHIGEISNNSIMAPKGLDYDSINDKVKKVAYAVRGELYLRASELQKEGKKIIFTNVGNPHALGQKPLTFPRQVIALCQAPFLLDDPNVGLVFPADAIARAKHYLSITSGGLGTSFDVSSVLVLPAHANDLHTSSVCFHDMLSQMIVLSLLNSCAYSDSRGLPGIRKEVAEFIERRDGYPSDPELIFLTDGASKGVMQILNTIIHNENDGILVPVPQYPLYSATISLFGGSLVPYYLDESANWGLDANNLREAVAQAQYKGITVLFDMGPPISKEVQLVSFHTVSKGYWGECGQRGGYFEMTNIPPQMGLMVNPPKPGDISYLKFVTESKAILESLRKRAHIMTDGFNSCRNVVCNFTEGAMYSFPQIRLPPRAIEAAKQAGKVPDVFYCLKLLEATGISTVPGSGFGQKEGVFHLRTTILPAEEDMPAIMASFKKFNDEFMDQYEDHRGYSRM